MSRPSGKPTDQEPLTDAEYALLLTNIKLDHWRILCQLLHETGVRLGEAMALKKTDVTAGGIWVTREKRSDHLREHIKLSGILYSRLKLHANYVRSELVWPYSQSAAWLAIKNTATAARIRIGPDGKSTIHPHLFRHAFGVRVTRLNMGLAPLEQMTIAQKLLGHSNINSTLVYLQPNKKDVENARQKLIDGDK